jgi:hypothetical protein|tara:strand:+ start:60 stop:464 length:405 start_codon:yes stop_codon:yes gene_type:complete
MDPHKGGILQSIITVILNFVLYLVYGFLKIVYLFKKEDEFIEPSHVIPAPDHPISSFKLAQALNPKTEPLKLTRFSQDEDPYVRKAVCRNPSLPKVELEKLSKDQNKEVADEALRVLKNPNVVIDKNFPTQHGG